jgi:hypothetical protein
VRLVQTCFILGLAGTLSVKAETLAVSRVQTLTEKILTAKEHDWSLVKRVPRRIGQAGCPDGFLLRLKAREGMGIASAMGKSIVHPSPDVGVEVIPCETAERAADLLRLLAEQPKPDGVVRDLGDEAYLWGGPPHGSTTIKVRVGRMYLQISAPSEDVALRFAQLVTTELQQELKKAGDTQH